MHIVLLRILNDLCWITQRWKNLFLRRHVLKNQLVTTENYLHTLKNLHKKLTCLRYINYRVEKRRARFQICFLRI